jgi:acetyl-CoA acetyltransferase
MPQRRRAAAVAGTFQTIQGDLSHRLQTDVWWECAEGACADAGLRLADIDGLVGDGPEGVGIRGGLPGAVLGFDLLGKPLRFHADGSIGAAKGASNLNLAVYAVESGLADVVIMVNAVAGKPPGYGSANRDEAVAAMAMLSGPYEYIYGTTRVSDYAVLAQRHMYEFGTTSEQLAEVAVAQRHGATMHHLSTYGHRGPITIEDVVTSRLVADPLHLLDCCAINQGGGAVIVVSADDVRALGRHPAIGLLGYGEGHGHVDPNAEPSLAEFPAATLAANTAFEQAGVSRDNISVAGIGDHFTINVIFGLEAGGFGKPGEGGPFVEGGALTVGGRLPTNTAGGYLSFSHAGMCGIFTLVEVLAQLRGTAGDRQVPNARYGYLNGTGGAEQNNFSAILGEV